jgi:hypothetical protein
VLVIRGSDEEGVELKNESGFEVGYLWESLKKDRL